MWTKRPGDPWAFVGGSEDRAFMGSDEAALSAMAEKGVKPSQRMSAQLIVQLG